MDPDRKAGAARLLQRFGLGARPNDIDAMGGQVVDALRAEINPRAGARLDGAKLPRTSDALAELDEFRNERQRQRAVSMRAEEAIDNAGQKMLADPPPAARELNLPRGAPPPKPPPPVQPVPQQIFRAEASARWTAAVEARTGLAERMVWFWSNHFCVSVAKGQIIRVLAGAYEREAIRPHVFGRFADLLRAVEQHPAMLIYLDNRQSIGPNSRAGARRGRGLNENLAREILELHTLGVNSGYKQADVTALAKIMTGWTVVGINDEDGDLGEFRFNSNRHEPGPQIVLGKTYREEGVRQGERVLDDIARHPATAKFIANKLVRHFYSDMPTAALVQNIADIFLKTEGDLAQVTRALVDANEAQSMLPEKLRSPQEFLVAAMRATGVRPPVPQMLNSLTALGQPLWAPAGPNGFPDVQNHWANPEGIKVRLETAAALARQEKNVQSPVDILDAVLPQASDETRQAVARAESRVQGIALLLMSPEFQRR